MSYTLKSIHIYPIKSLQGIDLETADLVETGLQFDRQWMLVNDENQFITQRSFPQMAKFKTSISDNNLQVTSPSGDVLQIPLDTNNKVSIDVIVWKDTVNAMVENKDINEWFSEQLKTSCRLVKLLPHQKRLIDTDFANNYETVSFADGFPLLVVSQSSIDLLNSKLEEPVSMNRFRPNLVIEGLKPHAEDDLTKITINNIEIHLVKPCSRCTIPSIHQKTGEKRKDILRALIHYRQKNKEIFFGMNGIHKKTGKIKVNQLVSAE